MTQSALIYFLQQKTILHFYRKNKYLKKKKHAFYRIKGKKVKYNHLIWFVKKVECTTYM